MLEFFRSISARRNQDGASAVEYGLLVAGIAALVVAIVFAFGGVIKSAFDGTCKTIKGSRHRRRHLRLILIGSWGSPDGLPQAPPALTRAQARSLTEGTHGKSSFVDAPQILRGRSETREADREDGASAVEYGLLVAGIAALIVAIVFAFGGVVSRPLHRDLRRDRHGLQQQLGPHQLLIS